MSQVNTNKPATRNSSIELLRLLCMVYIVAYHAILKTPMWAESKYRAVSLVFHVGVPVFILISGYYQIQFRLKSLCRFVGMVLFYILLLYGLSCCFSAPKGNLFYALTPISHAEYWDLWFVPCYLMLYLVSPFYNKFINSISNKELWLLLVVMAIINYWFGWLFQAPSLYRGANLFNFLMIYTIGNVLHRHKDSVLKFYRKQGWAIVVYVLFSIVVVVGYLFMPRVRELWFRFFFNYDAPGTLISSMLLFLAFSGVVFCNKTINYVLKSSFAIYLIHANCIVVPLVFGYFYNHFYTRNTYLEMGYIVLYSVVICVACLFIDLLFRRCHQFLSDILLFKPVKVLKQRLFAAWH